VGFNVSSLLICCQIWNLYNLMSSGLSISREKFSVLMRIFSAWLLWIQNLIVLLQHFVD
jgi:hypothetical protein